MSFLRSILVLFALVLPVAQAVELPLVDTSTFPVPAVGYSDARIKNSTYLPPVNPSAAKIRPTSRVFKVEINDPLVFPGQAMAGHCHEFFGNTSINPNSNLNNLISVGNSTTTGGILDRSSGWEPCMIDLVTHKYIKPDTNLFYYSAGYGNAAFDYIQVAPNGLRMLAGFANNTSPTSEFITKKYALWQCFSRTTGMYKQSSTIPYCDRPNSFLRRIVAFPQCWDGVHLDSADHRSHMAYVQPNSAPANDCPTTHPVRILQVSFNVDYPVDDPTVTDTRNWALASDDISVIPPGSYGLSAHGDWVFAIDPHVQELIVNNCLRNPNPSDCGGQFLGADPALGGQLRALIN